MHRMAAIGRRSTIRSPLKRPEFFMIHRTMIEDLNTLTAWPGRMATSSLCGIQVSIANLAGVWFTVGWLIKIASYKLHLHNDHISQIRSSLDKEKLISSCYLPNSRHLPFPDRRDSLPEFLWSLPCLADKISQRLPRLNLQFYLKIINLHRHH